MSKQSFHAIWMLLALFFLSCGDEETPRSPAPSVNLENVVVSAEAAGEAWDSVESVVIPDLNNLEGLDGDRLQKATYQKNYFARYGIIATANHFYKHRNQPDNRYIVQIYLFDTEAALQTWWNWKFVSPPFGDQWQAVEKQPYRTIDNQKMKKRVVAMGRLLVHAQNSQDSDDHLDLMAQYIAKAKATLPDSVIGIASEISSKVFDEASADDASGG